MDDLDKEVEEREEETEEEYVFGSTRNCPQRALNQRKNFIDGKNTYSLPLGNVGGS